DPTGDNTDTYAFTAKNAPGDLTIVANWIPFEDPAGGPNFYRFDDNARYYLNIDNTGDGKPDVRYLFDFSTKTRNPNTFLYGLGKPIQGNNSPNQNIVQTYTLTRESLQNGNIVSSKVLGTKLPSPPDNVGPKTKQGYVKTDKSKNAVVGVWASTDRQSIDVNGNGSGAYNQISRLGNPLVNEVIIPLAKKDQFNRTTPNNDAANYGKYVLEPGLAAALNALFPGKINAPEHNRTDIVQAVLQGIPGLNAFPGAAG